MKRHPFEPARLISGLTALTVGTAYGLDALGLWHTPGPWLFLIIPTGLLLSAIIWTTTRRHPSQDTPE